MVRTLYAKDTFSNDNILDIYTEEYCLSDEIFQKYNARVGSPGDKDTVYQRLHITNDDEFIALVREDALYIKKYSDGTTTYSDSVNKNGGFYIARYEAGSTTPRTSGSEGATIYEIKSANGIPTFIANQTPYIYITPDQAKRLAESMYASSSFVCTLPTGAAWDRTLGWLINTTDKTLAEIVVNSSGWGNYSDASFDVSSAAQYSTDYGSSYNSVNVSYSKQPASGVLLTTGAGQTRNVSNNIFDLAGNVFEFTTEGTGVARGGSFSSSGLIKNVTYREYSYMNLPSSSFGFRAALYVL